MADLIELIAFVPVGADEATRKTAVLKVMDRTGVRPADIGVTHTVTVREVSPERRVGPTMKESIARRSGGYRIVGLWPRR